MSDCIDRIIFVSRRSTCSVAVCADLRRLDVVTCIPVSLIIICCVYSVSVCSAIRQSGILSLVLFIRLYTLMY